MRKYLLDFTFSISFLPSHMGINILLLCNIPPEYNFISRGIFVVIAIVISFLSIANIFKITQASSILRWEQSLYLKVCTLSTL